MTKQLNMVGKACPLPVVEAKKRLRASREALEVLVDNEEAAENLSRLAEEEGRRISLLASSGTGKQRTLYFAELSEEEWAAGKKSLDAPDLRTRPEEQTTPSDRTPFILVFDHDALGTDADGFGHQLLKSFLYAMSENDAIPHSILFYNRGVFLTAGEEEDLLSDLRQLEERGSRLLSCGLCLEHYKLKEKLKIGSISNMYEIVSLMSRFRTVRP